MSPLSVLVVDDEPAVRVCLTRLLVRAGWTVKTAGNCAEALAVLRSAATDAVILDVRMPDGGDGVVSGLDLLASLRKTAEFEQLPVVVLTGYFLSTDEDAAVRQNGASVLYKPADLRTIAARLSALCDGGPDRTRP